MDNIELFHHQKMVAAEIFGFRFETDILKSVLIIIGFVVVNNIETFQHKKMFDAETVDFRFEAHLFKSVPMILGFGCHDGYWDVLQ